jgi:hypothetical protein
VGLTIARHLVEAHGGHIQAESDGANQGSKFTLSFPDMATSSQNLPPAQMEFLGNIRVLENKDVLVIDEAMDMGKMLGPWF